MRIDEIQKALRDGGFDAWLFYDFHHRDPVSYSILGLDMKTMTTRRWFYLVPAEGEPIKLSHRVEPRRLDRLPGRQEFYLPWPELHEKLRAMLAGRKRVAMQYSPLNNIPYVALVDAGTIELVRSCGVEVVSSADLVQQFDAVCDEAGLASHRWAGDRVQKVKDEAFAMLGEALASSGKVNEFEVMRHILDRFEAEGMTSDGDVPIVGFNDHPADPHFEPTEDKAYTLKTGDTVLIDLWARRREPVGIYYDITWCGYAGDKPAPRYVEIFDVVRRARDAALEHVRQAMAAGRTCRGCDVDDVARKVVADAGYGAEFLHRTGHSIGSHVHGNGANIDNLETRDERRIVPGACFSLEPGIYLAGSMAVRSEINVLVTPAGSVEVHGPMQDELLRIG